MSEFHLMKGGKNGLNSWCKECSNMASKKWRKENRTKSLEYSRAYYIKHKEQMKTLAAREKLERQREFKRDILGGYIVHILNYPTTKERKYNAVSTAGEVFKTNDKREFMRFLEETV